MKDFVLCVGYVCLCVGVCGCVFVFTYERGHTFDISPTNEDNFKACRENYTAQICIGSPIGGNMSRSSLWQLSVRFSHKSPRFHCEKSECIGPRFLCWCVCVGGACGGVCGGGVCVCVCGVCVGCGVCRICTKEFLDLSLLTKYMYQFS